MGTYLRMLSESYLMNTNMKGFTCLCIRLVLTKVASALEGLISNQRIQKHITKIASTLLGALEYFHVQKST